MDWSNDFNKKDEINTTLKYNYFISYDKQKNCSMRKDVKMKERILNLELFYLLMNALPS